MGEYCIRWDMRYWYSIRVSRRAHAIGVDCCNRGYFSSAEHYPYSRDTV